MTLLLVISGLSAVIMLCAASYIAGMRSGAANRRWIRHQYLQQVSAMQRKDG